MVAGYRLACVALAHRMRFSRTEKSVQDVRQLLIVGTHLETRGQKSPQSGAVLAGTRIAQETTDIRVRHRRVIGSKSNEDGKC